MSGKIKNSFGSDISLEDIKGDNIVTTDLESFSLTTCSCLSERYKTQYLETNNLKINGALIVCPNEPVGTILVNKDGMMSCLSTSNVAPNSFLAIQESGPAWQATFPIACGENSLIIGTGAGSTCLVPGENGSILKMNMNVPEWTLSLSLFQSMATLICNTSFTVAETDNLYAIAWDSLKQFSVSNDYEIVDTLYGSRTGVKLLKSGTYLLNACITFGSNPANPITINTNAFFTLNGGLIGQQNYCASSSDPMSYGYRAPCSILLVQTFTSSDVLCVNFLGIQSVNYESTLTIERLY